VTLQSSATLEITNPYREKIFTSINTSFNLNFNKDNHKSIKLTQTLNLIIMFKKILVPWDGSKHSNHAFKVALDIAKKYDSKIKLITCLSHAGTGASYLDTNVTKEIFKTANDVMRKRMSVLKSDAAKSNISTTIDVLVTDSTVKQLVLFTKSNKIDLVVLGSHGLTGWKKILLGSVANGVLQQVNCPVLIVK